MRRVWSLVAVAALVGFVGCDKPRSTNSPPAGGKVEVTTDPATGKTDVDVNTKRRDVDVKVGPGGVDVDVDRDPTHPDGAKRVDVDVVPGQGVQVDIDGKSVRERIDERREERAKD